MTNLNQKISLSLAKKSLNTVVVFAMVLAVLSPLSMVNAYTYSTNAYTNPQASPVAQSCNINFTSDTGFSGYYYNLTDSHPDMQLTPNTPWSKVGRENDWYTNQYFYKTRIDSRLDFSDTSSFAVDQDLPGDPNHFAVNWRAVMEVPTTGYYNYTIASDDDSWLFIDNSLINDFGGTIQHSRTTREVYLTAGYHKFEVFYADRRTLGASFIFEPVKTLKFHPLPLGCNYEDVIRNQIIVVPPVPVYTTPTTTPPIYTGGQVLGVQITASNYACNPNLGYTKIKALYRTNISPDIWALLETGQKHYITSPESFRLYQCDWSKIQTVTPSFLNQFTNATLVRTPDNATVYHLFDRPKNQWLKLDIPSATVFVSYLNNYWGNVARINNLDMKAYPAVVIVKDQNNPNVYLIEDRTKRRFASEQAFLSRGFNWAEIATLNKAHMDSYITGTEIN